MYTQEWGDWFAVEIVDFNATSKHHTIQYVIDGWVEVVELSKYQVRFVDDSSYTHGLHESLAPKSSVSIISSLIDWTFSAMGGAQQ